MAPKYEIHYFPVRGRASMLRLLLEDQGIDYTYKMATADNWLEIKPTTPFGALPVLTVDGKSEIAQSRVILKFLGREHGLLGSSNIEAAQIEMYIEQLGDFFTKFGLMIYKDYENGLKPFVDSIPNDLAPFEKKLSTSGSDYLFSKLSAADYVLFDFLVMLEALSPGCLDKTPKVKAFYQKFGARPKVRAFLERPEIKDMKFTGSGRL